MPGQFGQPIEDRHRRRSAAGHQQSRPRLSARADTGSLTIRDHTVGTQKYKVPPAAAWACGSGRPV